MAIYVRMIDRFMSGWGGAQGKRNVYAVECATREQADRIEAVALRRPEMKYVTITMRRPKSDSRTVVSLKQFDELGAIWTGRDA